MKHFPRSCKTDVTGWRSFSCLVLLFYFFREGRHTLWQAWLVRLANVYAMFRMLCFKTQI
jgi:hypothetical protein